MQWRVAGKSRRAKAQEGARSARCEARAGTVYTLLMRDNMPSETMRILLSARGGEETLGIKEIWERGGVQWKQQCQGGGKHGKVGVVGKGMVQENMQSCRSCKGTDSVCEE